MGILMKSTRDRIMQMLLNNPRSTINELADAVGVNSISVRHHLKGMLADGLIAAEEERHGVGRPRLIYYLTEQGVEQFPTRYYRFTNRLLDQLKETLPAETVEGILKTMASGLAKEPAREAKNRSLEGRLALLKTLLEDEGFEVEWEMDNDTLRINGISCPYFHVGQVHPEVCSVDQTLISTVLAIPAQKINCVLNGDNQCTYIIQLGQAVENKS